MNTKVPKILLRVDAKKLGSSTYFTGKPCSRGHISVRFTVNGRCQQCHNEVRQKRRSKRPGYRTRTQMDMDRVGLTRVCSTCKKHFPNTEEFFALIKDKRKSWTGLSAECRNCRRERFIVRRTTPKGREQERVWAINGYYRRMEDPDNREQHRQNERNWRKKNPGKVKLFKWNQPHLIRLRVMERFAAKLNAMPPWLTDEHFDQIKRIYLRADERTQETGVKHEVDHYYPLRGRTSHGLHVPWNLCVIPKAENQAKANRDPVEFYKEKRRNRR